MAFCMKSSCKWQCKCFLSFLCAMILCVRYMYQDVIQVCKWAVTVGSVNGRHCFACSCPHVELFASAA